MRPGLMVVVGHLRTWNVTLTDTLWCTSRSIAAAVVIGSLKMASHFEHDRLLVSRMLLRSQRSARSAKSTSISARFCCT